jgi:hypothetical protein
MNPPPLKAVVDVYNNPMYVGHHDDCVSFMRRNKGWNDLRYVSDEGKLGRYSSYIL